MGTINAVTALPKTVSQPTQNVTGTFCQWYGIATRWQQCCENALCWLGCYPLPQLRANKRIKIGRVRKHKAHSLQTNAACRCSPRAALDLRPYLGLPL